MADRNPEHVALFSRPQSAYSAGGDAYSQPERDQQGQYDQQYQDDHKPIQVRNMQNVQILKRLKGGATVGHTEYSEQSAFIMKELKNSSVMLSLII